MRGLHLISGQGTISNTALPACAFLNSLRSHLDDLVDQYIRWPPLSSWPYAVLEVDYFKMRAWCEVVKRDVKKIFPARYASSQSEYDDGGGRE
jgi:hypothetical protein